MELEKTMNELKKDKMVFPKEKCTIVAFLIGKTSMGRMFSTGIFCSSNRMIKSISM
jgi:hypothetical protein